MASVASAMYKLNSSTATLTIISRASREVVKVMMIIGTSRLAPPTMAIKERSMRSVRL